MPSKFLTIRAHVMINLAKFNYTESGFSRTWYLIKNKIFRKLTENSTRLFIKGGDIISVEPQTCSVHEPAITNLIEYANTQGHSDFLIDIGANIGLTSCQNGSNFKEVICFEPNPLCVQVLRLNAEIGIENANVIIHEYGLGEGHGEFDLWIPKNNWGGAFVKNEDNAYSDEIRAYALGLEEIKKENHIIKRIKIRPAFEELSNMFCKLISNGLTRGVVKIDVEGMEGTILKALAAALPRQCDLVIVFENWDPYFDTNKLLDWFSDRTISIGKLVYKTPYRKGWPKNMNRLALLTGECNVFIQDQFSSGDPVGDMVLTIG